MRLTYTYANFCGSKLRLTSFDQARHGGNCICTADSHTLPYYIIRPVAELRYWSHIAFCRFRVACQHDVCAPMMQHKAQIELLMAWPGNTELSVW